MRNGTFPIGVQPSDLKCLGPFPAVDNTEQERPQADHQIREDRCSETEHRATMQSEEGHSVSSRGREDEKGQQSEQVLGPEPQDFPRSE